MIRAIRVRAALSRELRNQSTQFSLVVNNEQAIHVAPLVVAEKFVIFRNNLMPLATSINRWSKGREFSYLVSYNRSKISRKSDKI